jgi:hypothetical protein
MNDAVWVLEFGRKDHTDEKICGMVQAFPWKPATKILSAG